VQNEQTSERGGEPVSESGSPFDRLISRRILWLVPPWLPTLLDSFAALIRCAFPSNLPLCFPPGFSTQLAMPQHSRSYPFLTYSPFATALKSVEHGTRPQGPKQSGSREEILRIPKERWDVDRETRKDPGEGLPPGSRLQTRGAWLCSPSLPPPPPPFSTAMRARAQRQVPAYSMLSHHGIQMLLCT